MSTPTAVPELGRRPWTGAGGRWADAAALGMVLAGAGHLVAAYDHLAHRAQFAVFFFAVGITQLLLGPGLRRGARPAVVAAVLAATVGLLLLYVLSRTVPLGLSRGMGSDRPEDADLLSTAVVVFELVTVVALPALLPPRGSRIAVNVILAVGVAVWVSWFAGVIG